MGVEGWGGGGFPICRWNLSQFKGWELLRNCQRFGQLKSPGGERRAVLYLYSAVATRRVVTPRHCYSSGIMSLRK